MPERTTTRILTYVAATSVLAAILLSVAGSPAPEVLTNAAVTVLLMVPSALVAVHIQRLLDSRGALSPRMAPPVALSAQKRTAPRPTPTSHGPITAVLHHNTAVTDDHHGPKPSKPASAPLPLRPVTHPILAQAATFTCSHCESKVIAGLPHARIQAQRHDVRRRGRILAAVALTLIWAVYTALTVVRTGTWTSFFAEPWLVVIGPGWLTLLILGITLTTKPPSAAVVLSNYTSEISHTGVHRLVVTRQS